MKKGPALLLAAALAVTLLPLAACGAARPANPVQITGFSTYAETEVALPYVDPAFTSFTRPVIQSWYYDRLETDAERALYRAVLSALVDCAVNTRVFAVADSARAKAAAQAVLYDYPQFFETAGEFGIRAETNKKGETVGYYCVIYYPTGNAEAERAKRDRLSAAVNETLAGMAQYADDQNALLSALYDRVTGDPHYDFDEGSGDGSNRTAHTAFGCLVEEYCVCDGYARALELLGNWCGLDVAVVDGWYQNVSHSWNRVTLDGASYFCDPTADDTSDRYLIASNGTIFTGAGSPLVADMFPLTESPTHTYYLLTEAEISADHTFDTEYDGAFTAPGDGQTAAVSWFASRGLRTDAAGVTQKLTELITAARDAGEFSYVLFEVEVTDGLRYPERTVTAVCSALSLPQEPFVAANGVNTHLAVWVYLPKAA